MSQKLIMELSIFYPNVNIARHRFLKQHMVSYVYRNKLSEYV